MLPSLTSAHSLDYFSPLRRLPNFFCFITSRRNEIHSFCYLLSSFALSSEVEKKNNCRSFLFTFRSSELYGHNVNRTKKVTFLSHITYLLTYKGSFTKGTCWSLLTAHDDLKNIYLPTRQPYDNFSCGLSKILSYDA